MSAILFDNYRPIDRYDRAELCTQFAALAQATASKFSEVSLNWHFSSSNMVVHDIFWQGFPSNLWIEHDWTVHTNLVVNLSSHLRYKMHFNNIYGGASGVPIVGPPRVESDMIDRAVIALLTETSYWQLALTCEPFALTLSKERLALATYRFYPYQFYIDSLDYLTGMAGRIEQLTKFPIPVKPSVTPTHLPWIK